MRIKSKAAQTVARNSVIHNLNRRSLILSIQWPAGKNERIDGPTDIGVQTWKARFKLIQTKLLGLIALARPR